MGYFCYNTAFHVQHREACQGKKGQNEPNAITHIIITYSYHIVARITECGFYCSIPRHRSGSGQARARSARPPVIWTWPRFFSDPVALILVWIAPRTVWLFPIEETYLLFFPLSQIVRVATWWRFLAEINLFSGKVNNGYNWLCWWYGNQQVSWSLNGVRT